MVLKINFDNKSTNEYNQLIANYLKLKFIIQFVFFSTRKSIKCLTIDFYC